MYTVYTNGTLSPLCVRTLKSLFKYNYKIVRKCTSKHVGGTKLRWYYFSANESILTVAYVNGITILLKHFGACALFFRLALYFRHYILVVHWSNHLEKQFVIETLEVGIIVSLQCNFFVGTRREEKNKQWNVVNANFSPSFCFKKVIRRHEKVLLSSIYDV